MRRPTPAGMLAIVALAMTAACGFEPSRCVLPAAGAQPIHRFPAGSTLALPQLAAECGAATWHLAAAPDGNLNDVVTTSQGSRFTPHVPGVYALTIDGSDAALELTVIEGSGVPFQQYNYDPTRSLAVVGAEIWSANVYAASVTPIASGVAGAPIATGPWPVAIAWRPGMDLAVVAQRASDDLGLVDLSTHRIIDAIPVGDEPTNVVVSPDGTTAYVALAVSGRIAVVDLPSRTVARRIELVPDISALALSPDGRHLFAARLRSGQTVRSPFPDTPVGAQRDLFVVDTASGAIEGEVLDLGSTIRALEVSADGRSLYATLLRNETHGNLLDGQAHFKDLVVRLDPATGAVLASADLGRQSGTGGMAVTLEGMIELGDELWICAEGSDAVIVVDRATLSERRRIAAPGRPRALVAADHRVYIHGPQGFVVTSVARSGSATTTISTARDPRPEPVARGQQAFTGAGKAYGADHACSSCHPEALTDTLVWKVGPVGEYATPRPLFWLEGTYPLGWPGYLSDVRNWGYEGGSTTGVRPTTAQAEELAAYLASIVPPPPANDWTLRDGGLTDAARRGKQVFEGDGSCSRCHRGPLFTSREQLEAGVTPGRSDVPSLIGAYRHGVWLKDGSATTLDEAISRVVAWLGVELTRAQLADVTEYVRELTARDFFLLASSPRADDVHAAIDQPIELTFSAPVWGDASNLARISLVDGDGARVPTTIVADARRVTITPTAPLAFGMHYQVVIAEGFEAFDERTLAATHVDLTTAAAPATVLDGAYAWSFGAPSFNPQTGMFDPTHVTKVTVPMTATPTLSGAALTFDLGQGLAYTRRAVIDGDTLVLLPLPVPVGPTLANVSPKPAQPIDLDADGKADAVTGTLLFTGPGIYFDDLGWSIARPPHHD